MLDLETVMSIRVREHMIDIISSAKKLVHSCDEKSTHDPEKDAFYRKRLLGARQLKKDILKAVNEFNDNYL